MKIELEITEKEIRDALARKVRVAIADQTNQWSVDQYITQVVKKHWQETADSMVKEYLSNSEAMKEKILAAIDRKLRAQINALTKAAKS